MTTNNKNPYEGPIFTQVIRNLFDAFPELGKVPETNLKTMESYEVVNMIHNKVSIGAEVEVRWRHYFPDLYWLFMRDKPYSLLSPAEQDDLYLKCRDREIQLIPRLKLVEYCGVPRGKDKYWEFAFKPYHNPAILAYEVQLMRQLNLIPTNFKHSLHITIGGLEPGFDAGMVLMALELLGFTSKERILEAARSDKAASWGRKGRAGMRPRGGDSVQQLSLGKTIGVELRTLELPTDEKSSALLFYVAYQLANCATNDAKEYQLHWNKILEELDAIAFKEGFDISENWGRPYDNPDIWNRFAKKLKSFDVTKLAQLVNEISSLEENESDD